MVTCHIGLLKLGSLGLALKCKGWKRHCVCVGGGGGGGRGAGGVAAITLAPVCHWGSKSFYCDIKAMIELYNISLIEVECV